MRLLTAITIFATTIAFGEERPDVFELEDLKALAKEDPKRHVYRVTVHRSFDPELVFELNIWPEQKDGMLVTKKARMEEVDGFTKTTKLIKNSSLRLNALQIQSFLRLIEQAGIPTLPEKDWTETTIIQDEPIANSIMDGSLWTIEMVEDGKYHLLTRRSPPTVIALMPDDLIEEIGPRRIYREGVLLNACVWLWVLGDESDEAIY